MSLLKRIDNLKLLLKNRRLLLEILEEHTFFSNHPDQSVWGSISEDDEEGIKFAVSKAREFEGPIVEIGTLFGFTANLIASLKDQERELITIDNFCWNPFWIPPDAHRLFAQRTMRYILDHCRTRLVDEDVGVFYASNPDIKPSMVFIDAGHDYKSVCRDVDWALSSGCPVIAGHDYTEIHPGVIKAVDERFEGAISVFGSVWIHETGNSSRSR